MNRSLGQHDHSHDCNLDDHSQYLDVNSDHKQNPNLEAPMNTTGTVWADDDVDSITADTGDKADTADDTFYCDASGEPQSEGRVDNRNSKCQQESWSNVVRRHSGKLAHTRGHDNGA